MGIKLEGRDEDGLTNLLEETLEALASRRKGPSHVRWVGSADGKWAISWDEFVLIAKGTNYASSFGSAEIMRDLVIVGTSWWLSRGEYDGSEWWDFNECPTQKISVRPFNRVVVTDDQRWESTIAGLMRVGEEEDND